MHLWHYSLGHNDQLQSCRPEIFTPTCPWHLKNRNPEKYTASIIDKIGLHRQHCLSNPSAVGVNESDSVHCKDPARIISARTCLGRSCCRSGRAEILVDSSRRRLAVMDDRRAHMTTYCRGCCLKTAYTVQHNADALHCTTPHFGSHVTTLHQKADTNFSRTDYTGPASRFIHSARKYYLLLERFA